MTPLTTVAVALDGVSDIAVPPAVVGEGGVGAVITLTITLYRTSPTET